MIQRINVLCKYGKLRCNFQGKKTQFINLKLRTIRPIFILISYILVTFGSCDAVMVDVLCGEFQSVVVDVRCGECLIFFLMAFFSLTIVFLSFNQFLSLIFSVLDVFFNLVFFLIFCFSLIWKLVFISFTSRYSFFFSTIQISSYLMLTFVDFRFILKTLI